MLCSFDASGIQLILNALSYLPYGGGARPRYFMTYLCPIEYLLSQSKSVGLFKTDTDTVETRETRTKLSLEQA